MKKFIPISLGIITSSVFMCASANATTNYLEKLDNSLVNNTLLIKAENPTQYDEKHDGYVTNNLADAISGIIGRQYGTSKRTEKPDGSIYTIVTYNNDNYTTATFTVYESYSSDEVVYYSGMPSHPRITNTLATKTINLSFTGIDNSKKQNVIDAAQNVLAYDELDGWENHEHYVLEDLPIINYITSTPNCSYAPVTDVVCLDSKRAINYSPEYRQHIANKNISIIVDPRAGDTGMFGGGEIGMGALTYDGYIYHIYYDVGVDVRQILYIPNNTANTHEAYANAALSRINNYLSKTPYANKFSISYAGQLDHEESGENEYYTLTFEGNNYNFIIKKDDSKIGQMPSFITVDNETGVIIENTDNSIPLDSAVNVIIVNENDRIEQLLQLGLKLAKIFDISIYSNVANKYIEYSDNEFIVKIPLDERFNGKKLAAYYIDKNGEVQKYKVSVENGYAVFKTKHFSEYILGEDNEIEPTIADNPQTSDNIHLYALSFIGFISTGLLYAIINKRQ